MLLSVSNLKIHSYDKNIHLITVAFTYHFTHYAFMPLPGVVIFVMKRFCYISYKLVCGRLQSHVHSIFPKSEVFIFGSQYFTTTKQSTIHTHLCDTLYRHQRIYCLRTNWLAKQESTFPSFLSLVHYMGKLPLWTKSVTFYMEKCL